MVRPLNPWSRGYGESFLVILNLFQHVQCLKYFIIICAIFQTATAWVDVVFCFFFTSWKTSVLTISDASRLTVLF